MEFSEHSRQTRTSLDVSESRRPADLNLTSRMKPLSRQEKEKTPPVPQRVFRVCFLGSASVDPKSAQSMLPCVIEVKRRGSRQDILLEVKVPFVRAVGIEGKKIVFEHKLQSISCFAQTALDHCCFSYLTKENPDTPHTCYVFHAPEESTVQELFTTMRETTKELQQGSSGGGSLLRRDSSIGNIPILSSDPTHNTFQHFEVMYVGKIKVSHRKAPPTFIDEALEKFRLHDLEKLKVRTAQGRQRHGSGASVSSMPASNGDRLERSVSVRENELRTQVENLRYSSGSENSSLENLVGLGDSSTSAESLSRFPRAFSSNAISRAAGGSSEELVVPAGVRVRANSGDVIRSRAFSNGYNDMPRRGRSETMPSGSTELNRTMLFQIGKNELGLISLDKKLIILNKGFKDISHCSQGIKQSDHFGFICRDNNVDTYVGYVFKCQSQAVTDEIMGALKQAFTTAAALHLQQGNKSNFCDTCPMYWYYRLYCDVDGVGPNKAHMIILKYLETLTSDEQRNIRAKYEGADVNDPEVQNDIMMTLLRAMCESKQTKHMHTSEPSHKVDMGFLDKKNTSVIDDLKKKAKRSLTSSFENILKVHRKSQDAKEVFRERSHTIDADHSYHRQSSSDETSPSEAATRKESLTDLVDSARDVQPSFRPRSSTVGGTMDLRREQKWQANQQAKPKHSPMMNIFMKVGNQAKTPPPQEDKTTPQRKQSWRQTIFNRVVTPQNKQIEGAPHFMTLTPASPIEETQSVSASGRRSPASLRALWKKAIKEQILLIRMEKENKKLRANEVAIQNKKMKLDYEEITPCLKEVTKVWDQMLTHYNRPNEKFDRQKVLDAVKAGVPRQKRGDIWQLLAEQHEPKNNCCLPTDDVDFSVTYEDLLCRLTSHQHAILIDLNRTFPNHPYFSKRLGPGQLALFNLLKAYSLFDREVGYCQGLSFIAGVLLLHIEENAAFEMLKHMLFRLGLRKQYKPDMVALQIQMYQLSRLVRDKYPDLDEHLEQHEIAPTLYAAPWFLTLFASQFPLGFVARVFDLLFLYGMEVIFKVALVLLGNHKELLMQCHSFESVMEFLKTTLPSLGVIQMERTINQVFTMDIASQLHDYEVEYHVLQEEMFASPQRSSLDVMQQLEATNRNLTRKNSELCEQLDSAHSTIHNLETRMSNYQNSISRLETRVHELELERLNLKKTVEALRQKMPSPSSWEEASIETDLSLQLDADTPTSLTVTGASLDGDVTSPSSASLGTDSTEGTEKASPDSSEEGLDEDDQEVATLTRISNGGLSVPRERNLSGESGSSVFSNLSNSPIVE